MDELIRTAEWHIKYRMPSGTNIALTSKGAPIQVYQNKYLNKRIESAENMIKKFRGFDLAIIYAKEPKTGRDLGEIARFDNETKRLVFSTPL